VLPAAAQERATVAVDDSPTAIQLLAQASDQAAANPAESARLIRQVLADFSRKLIPVADDPDRFTDARAVAERLLKGNGEVLKRWRALESAEALRQVESGDVESAAAQRMLTPAGLRAQLVRADEALVHAHFGHALAQLEAVAGHPDLVGESQQRALRIEALAAWGAGDRARAEAAADRIDPDAPGQPALAALIRSPPPDSPDEVNDPLSPQPFGDIGGAHIRLWQESLDQSLTRRVLAGSDARLRVPMLPDSAAERGKYLVSVPALSRGLVIVNEGHRVQALGVFTREPVWSLAMMSPGPLREGSVGDLSVPVVCGDRVLAISGHSSGGDRDGGIDREGGGRLVCCALDDGRRLWEFQPRWHARAGLEGTFIVGTPAVVEDTVAILLRRLSPRQETISFAAGISLLDGSLRWIAPLGATPGIRATSSAIKPCATPVAMRDSFIVQTSAGVTARLSSIDGRVLWLRRDQVPISDARWELEPWQMQRPAVCGDRIMVIDPDLQHVQVLDATDGRQLLKIPIGSGTAWGGTRWLLASADGAHVLGIGDEVICFASADLRTPLWSCGGPRAPRAGASGAAVVGRVQAGTLPDGRGAVAIPMGGRVSVRALADGTELASLDAGVPSNPSLRDGIGSLSTDDALSMFVDSARTEQLLAGDARDGDPTAIAGMLELAIASSRPDLAGSASQMASAWLARDVQVGGEVRSQLADQLAALLIDVACAGLLSAQESADLFERVIAREADPSRRAQALLVQGDWFERSGKFAAAVAVWRRILADRALAGSWLRPIGDDSLVLRAGIAARQRLAAIDPARAGPAARSPGDRPPSSSAGIEALIAYAGAASGSRESVDAWMAAAEAACGAGDRVRAAAAASAAVDESIALREASLLASTLDSALAILARMALPDTAARLVDRAVASGMDVPLPSRKGEAASRARAQMPSSSIVRGEPRVAGARASKQVQPLRGTPIAMTPRAHVTRPTDRVWLAERGALSCLSADSLQQIWRAPLVGQSPTIVQHIPAGIVLWDVLDADRSSLAAIDDAGAPRWSIADLDALVDGDDPGRPAAQDPVPRFGRESSVRIGDLHPGPADLVLVRADGAIAAIDCADGTVRWRSKGAYGEIVSADADDSMVVIAEVPSGGDGSARALVLDRASGRPVAVLEDPDVGSVRWVQVVAPGQVAVGHDNGTSRWDIVQDRVSWTRDDPASLRSTGIDGVVGNMLLHSEGRVHAIRWFDGTSARGAFAMLTERVHRPSEWVGFARTGDVIVAGDERGVGLFSLDGTQLGATVAMPDRTIHSACPVGAGLVVTEQAGRVDPAMGIGGRVRSRLRLQLLGWSEGLKMVGSPVSFDVPAQSFGTLHAVDGWIVVPAGKDTSYAVPIPSG
jgi:outer membrane protein assembly factor BamB